jgi:hypothetical protein
MAAYFFTFGEVSRIDTLDAGRRRRRLRADQDGLDQPVPLQPLGRGDHARVVALRKHHPHFRPLGAGALDVGGHEIESGLWQAHPSTILAL